MNESILDSIKKMLGIHEDYEYFNTDIIMAINTVFAILYQLGVGNVPFRIEGHNETWGEFIPEGVNLETIKTYVYLKTKTIFDPSASSSIMNAQNEILRELEYRISIEVDPRCLL